MNTLVKKYSFMMFSLFLTSCFAFQDPFSPVRIKQEILRFEDAEVIRFVKPFQFMCTYYKTKAVIECVQRVEGTWTKISPDKFYELAFEFARQD